MRRSLQEIISGAPKGRPFPHCAAAEPLKCEMIYGKCLLFATAGGTGR